MKVLAGDIGGTNARLGYFDVGLHELKPIAPARVFAARQYESLTEIVREFAATGSRAMERACFALAGPVRDGVGEMPNLGWRVDAAELSSVLGCPVSLVNDLEANAHGLDVLQEHDCSVLARGAPRASGNRVLISAGTGLGEAGLFWDGSKHWTVASEGGHSDFAPRTEQEVALLLYLQREFGHVSYERILSGAGLHNIYRFLRDAALGREQSWVRDRMASEDPASVISGVALDRQDTLCAQALGLFVSIYGAEAGNLALKFMATGGVYLGGGIAPKIAASFLDPAFVAAFNDKGRLRPQMEAIPIVLVLNDQTALLGAARFAAGSGVPDPTATTEREAVS